MARQLDCLNYWDAQARNSKIFKSLTRQQRTETKQQGYNNRGWDNVIISWRLIKPLKEISPQTSNLTYLCAYKAEKSLKHAKANGNPFEVLSALKEVLANLKEESKATDTEWDRLSQIANES